MELSAEQIRAVEDGEAVPVTVEHTQCVLLRADIYERVKAMLEIAEAGTGLRRDNLVSVMYAEELNSTTSSVTHQRTDRHEILDQKLEDFQESL